MVTRVATVLIIAAMAAAVNAECHADDGDSINLSQTQGTALLQQGLASSKSSVHLGAGQAPGPGLDMKAVWAELVAMILFVIIGCGSAMAVAKEPGWVLQVSMSFGLGITALAYSIGHFSGGHINPAVTFGLVLAGKCSVLQGCMNALAQFVGATIGAGFLMTMFSEEKDKTGGLGANGVSEDSSKINALAAEFFGTFLLVFVVFQTAVNPQSQPNREMAALAIGLAVFLAHCILIPIDGCSINPARSFGPALVRKICYKKNSGSLDEMWVFCVGPLLGAAGAALLSTYLLA